MNGRPKGAMLPAVWIGSLKSSTVSSIGCRLSGCRHRIARRSVGREVVADPVGVKSRVSTKSMVGVVEMASPGIAAPVSLANTVVLLAQVCGAKAVLLVRRGPTCRLRCAR